MDIGAGETVCEWLKEYQPWKCSCTLSRTVTNFLFALLYADTSDCLLSYLPHPLTGLLYFYDPILLPPVLYDIYLVLRYDLSCTIHIYEALIRLLVVLGEFRFPST